MIEKNTKHASWLALFFGTNDFKLVNSHCMYFLRLYDWTGQHTSRLLLLMAEIRRENQLRLVVEIPYLQGFSTIPGG